MITSIRLMSIMVISLLLLTACTESADEQGEDDVPTSTPEPESSSTLVETPTSTPEEDPQPAPVPAQSGGEDLEIPHYEFPSGNQEIYRLDLESGEQTRVTDDERQYLFPVWSPDGERIAAVVENRDRPNASIMAMDRSGDNAHELAIEAERGRIAWSPDGDTLSYASADAGEIALIEADGTNPHQLTHQEPVEPIDRYFSVSSPAWSPDGSQIVFPAMQSPRDEAPAGVAEL